MYSNFNRTFFPTQTALELEKLPSFEARLQRVAELVSGKTGLVVDLVRIKFYGKNEYPTYGNIILKVAVTAKSFLKKIFAAHHYKPTNKVNADVLLFKPSENYAKLTEDYGLREVKSN